MVLQDKCQPMDRAAGVFLDKEERTEQALNLALDSEEKKKDILSSLTRSYLLLIYIKV